MGSSSALFVSLALMAVAAVVLAVPAPLSSEEDSAEINNFRSGCIEEEGSLKCRSAQFNAQTETEEECTAKGLAYIEELMVCDHSSTSTTASSRK